MMFSHDLVVSAVSLSAGFFFAEMTIGPMWAVPMDIAPHASGTASGIMNSGSALAAIISPVVGGYLIDATGNWQIPFVGSMALMLVVARLSAGFGPWLWPLGAVAIALKFAAPWAMDAGWLDGAFNTPALNWIGLISVKPITEDYVPVLPWMAVVWWAMAATQWCLRRSAQSAPPIKMPALPALVLRPLAFLGRWSLSYYLLHQPVMLGFLWLWMQLQT
jgi:hypothetical protein